MFLASFGVPCLPSPGSPNAVITSQPACSCESRAQRLRLILDRYYKDDEVAYLPSIVDAAESSPAAAAECARLIRKFLYQDEWTHPYLQYNAIMLLRILVDNPGPSFTRNINQKFVDATKTLLRGGRDPSVRQLLMDTLDAFEVTIQNQQRQNAVDENLASLVAMWLKEKEKAYKAYGVGGFYADRPR